MVSAYVSVTGHLWVVFFFQLKTHCCRNVISILKIRPKYFMVFVFLFFLGIQMVIWIAIISKVDVYSKYSKS